ncbi:MAG: MFS transporter [Pseudomonadales bacterium]|nr:MFS transporter [Pseudomonadales bacterium]RLU02484.1 MAG: MFS transporter [Ketobacter sp.]
MTTTPSVLNEWRNYWHLAIAAGLGYATAVLYVYSMGPFIEPIHQEFGWSYGFISSGITIAAGVAAVCAIPVGIAVDKVGPRLVGLIGVPMMAAAVALLGTATGTELNWYILWSLVALATLPVQATVWAAAVTSRFKKSRGLALAVTLSGASVGAAIFPVLATWLIESYGWKIAYMGMSGIWLIIVFPMLLLFFRGATDEKRKPEDTASAEDNSEPVLTGITLPESLRLMAFYKLFFSAGFFALTVVGINVHFVPILQSHGTERLAAAGIAGLIGIFSIVGRFGTGFLLDKFSAHIIGGIAFVIPISACAVLLIDGGNPLYQSIAACIFGLTLGAEVDVVAFLTAKYFGLKYYGSVYGAMVMSLALGVALGPLSAGIAFDTFGTYDHFLILTMVLTGISAIALFTMGATPAMDQEGAKQHEFGS